MGKAGSRPILLRRWLEPRGLRAPAMRKMQSDRLWRRALHEVHTVLTTDVDAASYLFVCSFKNMQLPSQSVSKTPRFVATKMIQRSVRKAPC